ncbi:MAG: 23S rRNA (pseudouridine(1915)-N(3))-methyltransferase RlmH [Calditerrivibrio sp.]|nr:23S rRNA (pseudouridine(1915)-N(3))-methyltransferase RlmH [Calditerrivibrio sp.]
MKIRVVLAGKVKDINYQRIIEEYEARIRLFYNFELVELRVREDTTLKDKDTVKMLDIGREFYRVGLDPSGAMMTSEMFAESLKEMLNKCKNVVFYIGGAYGLGKDFTSKCDRLISLSKMTFAHRIALVVLMEQIYRAFTIINNHPYHK